MRLNNDSTHILVVLQNTNYFFGYQSHLISSNHSTEPSMSLVRLALDHIFNWANCPDHQSPINVFAFR